MHLGTWPASLRARAGKPYLAGQSLTGGRSIGGTSQSVATDAGYWRIDLSGIALRSAPQLRAWRQIEGALDGRANTIDVGACDFTRPFGLASDLVGFDDGTTFDDGTLFLGEIGATLAADAALRAVELSVTKLESFLLIGGETFSLEHDEPFGNRLYRVTAIVEQSDVAVTIRVTPPLRAAIGAGARVELVEPRCRMKLLTDEAMAADVDLGRFSQPSVSFVEDI